MSSNKRILNISRGFTLKYKQALRAIEECACAWVEYGISIRDLTLQESIQERSKQAKDREPLPFAEVHGLVYEPAANSQNTNRESLKLAYEANKLVAMGV